MNQPVRGPRRRSRGIGYAQQCLDHERLDQSNHNITKSPAKINRGLELASLAPKLTPTQPSKTISKPTKPTKRTKTLIKPPSPKALDMDIRNIEPIQTVLVIDTNFAIDNLPILEELGELCPIYGHTIIIPWMVIQELDKLKGSFDNDKAHKARLANNWIYQQLAKSSVGIMGQTKQQTYESSSNGSYHASSGLRGDDSILDCVLYFALNVSMFTVLLSNDKNLCAKALIYKEKKITTVSAFEDRTMTAKKIAELVNQAAQRLENGKENGNNNNMNYTDGTMEMDMDMDIDMDMGADMDMGMEEEKKEMEMENTPNTEISINYNQPNYRVFAFTNNTTSKVSITRTLKGLHFAPIYKFILGCLTNGIEYHLSQAYDVEAIEDIIQCLLKQPWNRQSTTSTFHLMAQVLDKFRVSLFGEILNLRKEIPDYVTRERHLSPIPDKQLIRVGDSGVVSKDYMNKFMDLWKPVVLKLAQDSLSDRELRNLHEVLADIANLKE